MQFGKRIRILCNNPSGQSSKEGTAVAIKKDYTKETNIRTTIQVIALEVYLIGKGKRTVCSIYLLSTD